MFVRTDAQSLQIDLYPLIFLQDQKKSEINLLIFDRLHFFDTI